MSLRLLLAKDLRREWQTKESLLAGLVLVGLFYILFLFVGGTSDRHVAIALWTPLVYATAAMTGRGLATESDRGTLEWVLTAPVSRALHGWSRTITDLLIATVLVTITAALAVWTFGIQFSASLGVILALATVGLTVMGSLVGGIAAQARMGHILMPILFLPVAAPLVHAGVTATLDALAGADIGVPLRLMLGYDIIAVGLAWLLWPQVLGAD